jgi:hypothetical protein
MYTIAEDGTLQKDGKMCFCMNTDTSCTASCAAFEERAKDRVWLACMSREIIAKPAIASLAAPEMTGIAKRFNDNMKAAAPKPEKIADPLGIETKKTVKTMRRTK